MVQKPDRRSFGTQRPGISPASRSAQQRLMFLVAMLVLVLILMQQAAQPEMWQWLWRDTPSPTDASLTDLPPTGAPDQFRVPLDSADSEEFGAAEVSGEFKDEIEGAPGGSQGLADVRDDTYFRQAESPAWFEMYRKLQATPLETLEELGRDRQVSYLQLYRQMPAYRGEVVRLSGLVRRAQRVPTVDNEDGFDSHWQLWFFEDERADSPIVIYALNLPADFPEGDGLKEPVSITGYAFKRWAYPAQGGLMVAPVVLAKQPVWTPTTPTESNPSTSPPQVGMFVATAVIFAFVVLRFLMKSPTRPTRLPIRRKVTTDQPPDFDFLKDEGEERTS